MKRNLQEFWTVQPASGLEAHIFASFGEAEQAIDKWNAQLDAEFEKWERGESSSVLIDSRIGPDGFGGCYQNCVVHPAARPGGIYHFSAYECNANEWVDNPGFHKIKWGNPALARPAR